MQDEDYAAQFPFETTEALIELKLIKVLTDGEAQSGTQFMPAQARRSVTVQEADNLMGDEVAELLVEKAGGVSDRTRTGIVNIDTLSRYFTDGENVTLEEVKKRVPNFSNKVTYLNNSILQKTNVLFLKNIITSINYKRSEIIPPPFF